MQLVQDRNTPQMDATAVPLPVRGDQVIFAGSIVCVDMEGFAVPGSAANGHVYAGRAESRVNSMGLAHGEVSVVVRRKCAFKWANDGTVTQEHLMRPVFVVDDQTVAAAGGALAGFVVRFEDDGVWVE